MKRYIVRVYEREQLIDTRTFEMLRGALLFADAMKTRGNRAEVHEYETRSVLHQK